MTIQTTRNAFLLLSLRHFRHQKYQERITTLADKTLFNP